MYIKSINNVVGYKDLPDGFNIEFNENKTYIVGANFQRKTTVGSLFNWCLTGTSLNGKEKEQVANDTKRVSNVIVDITFVDNFGIEHRLIRDKGKEIHLTLDGKEIKQENLAQFYKNKDIFLVAHNPYYFWTLEPTDVTIADLERMNQNDLTNYLFFLDNTLENISKTRNRKLASMKRLYEYLETNNLINVNPTKWMQSATIEKRQPKYLDLNESKQLLANAINSDCRYKIRNYAITCLFLNCSLRLSELVGINLSDLKIDNSEQTLKVTGKGNKQRIIYLNSAVCEAINAYIKIRPKLDKSNKDYNALFLSSRGKRISKRSVQNIIKSELVELVEAEGKESKKYHTHTLRHTGATLLYNEANANIFVLKIILGHESLDATQVYTHVSDKKLKELMQNFNILDRKE